VNKKRLFERWVDGYLEKLRPKQILACYSSNDVNWWKNASPAEFNGMWGGEVTIAKSTPYMMPETVSLYFSSDEKHKDFVAVAAANTVGKGGDMVYTGRNRLDGASLERWWQIQVEYNTGLEKTMCPDNRLYTILNTTRNVFAEKGIKDIISTRAFRDVYRLSTDGLSEVKMWKSLTLSWNAESKKIFDGIKSSNKKASKKVVKKDEVPEW